MRQRRVRVRRWISLASGGLGAVSHCAGARAGSAGSASTEWVEFTVSATE